VADYPWFHSIDLGGGVITPGHKTRQIHEAEVRAFFDPIELTGASVIDIGAWNGLYSFTAKQRGAARVLATDHFCWNHADFRGRETFELARDALGLDVEMRDIDVPDLSVAEVGSFEVVLFLGVFYHLYDPIDGLRRAASLATEVLVFETHIDLRSIGRPAMVFYPRAELNGDPTNWWGPNVPLIRELLTGLGFTRIDIVTTPSSRAIVHAWKSTRLQAVGWTPPEPPPRRGRSPLARVARVLSQRYILE
jgi:tRNA (mo5U34)-methyltransferase